MLITQRSRDRPEGIEGPDLPGRREIAPDPDRIGAPGGAQHDLGMAGGGAPPTPERREVVRHLRLVERELHIQIAASQRLRERHAGNVGQPAATDALHPRILGIDTGH